MKLPLFWIDAFTRRVFRGNPAGVCPLNAWLPDQTMQQIAFENGLAETAFFVPAGAGRYRLRWFTPQVEVDLCGHATLASAYVVLNELQPSLKQVIFDSRSGPLVVARRDDLFELDFPSRPAGPAADVPKSLLTAVGGRPGEVRSSANSYLLAYDRIEKVAALRPDFGALRELGDVRILATAPGDDCDFVSRFFAPGAGIDEDSVTGSAHCTLVPYWAERLSKKKFHARQISQRTGELWCELAGPRVKIAGHAVLYLRGTIEVDPGNAK